jgi:Fe-S cluster assembly iron-binding protein IscA
MVLDEPADNDEIFDRDGIQYIIEKSLFETVKPINVDFVTQHGVGGFIVTSSLAGSSACGGSCSC